MPLFSVGDRVVVDRRTNLLPGDPWLETIVGRVRSIDDESGAVSILDEEGDPRHPPCRWFSLRDELTDFRFAPARGNPFNVPAVPKREAPATPVDPSQPKRKGRPKGSKNRPKEEIRAEREAYKKMRAEKKAKRKNRAS